MDCLTNGLESRLRARHDKTCISTGSSRGTRGSTIAVPFTKLDSAAHPPPNTYGLGWMIGFREPTWDYNHPTRLPKPPYASNLRKLRHVTNQNTGRHSELP